MREVSPIAGMSVDEYVGFIQSQDREGWAVLGPILNEIRSQKNSGERRKPSVQLIDTSNVMTASQRRALLDKVAELVDENWCGRSEMCLQFAMLLHAALQDLGIRSRIATGTATYFDERGRKLHDWWHAWVRIGQEVVDGNVDCLDENLCVPKAVRVRPYWGPITDTPKDRQIREDRSSQRFSSEIDVSKFWWPDLKRWLDETGWRQHRD
ncbi:MAG TPA: hypothetical protein V6D22_14980 [Candidatus Obscuribacterales bacterium]